MALEFLKDAGVYLPPEDGIKFTAILDGHAREFIVTRAALIAAGAAPTMDPASLLRFFEQYRKRFEAAAANVLSSVADRYYVQPADMARAGLAAYAAQPGALMDHSGLEAWLDTSAD